VDYWGQKKMPHKLSRHVLDELLSSYPPLDAAQYMLLENIANCLDQAQYLSALTDMQQELLEGDLLRISGALEHLKRSDMFDASPRATWCINAVLQTKQDPIAIAWIIVDMKWLFLGPSSRDQSIQDCLSRLIVHPHLMKVEQALFLLRHCTSHVTFLKIDLVLSHKNIFQLIKSLEHLYSIKVPADKEEHFKQYVPYILLKEQKNPQKIVNFLCKMVLLEKYNVNAYKLLLQEYAEAVIHDKARPTFWWSLCYIDQLGVWITPSHMWKTRTHPHLDKLTPLLQRLTELSKDMPQLLATQYVDFVLNDFAWPLLPCQIIKIHEKCRVTGSLPALETFFKRPIIDVKPNLIAIGECLDTLGDSPLHRSVTTILHHEKPQELVSKLTSIKKDLPPSLRLMAINIALYDEQSSDDAFENMDKIGRPLLKQLLGIIGSDVSIKNCRAAFYYYVSYHAVAFHAKEDGNLSVDDLDVHQAQLINPLELTSQIHFILSHQNPDRLVEGLIAQRQTMALFPKSLVRACFHAILRDQCTPNRTSYMISQLCKQGKLELTLYEQARPKHPARENVVSLSHDHLIHTKSVQENNLYAGFFFRNYPKKKAKNLYDNENGINPAYCNLASDVCPIPVGENRIWALRGDLILATGIKNCYHSEGATSIVDKIDRQSIPFFQVNNRYGHPSLAAPELKNDYDGSVYYAGWLYQQPDCLQIYLWSGRYRNRKLTIEQRTHMEAYIAKKLQEAYGDQQIMFFDWVNMEESEYFLAGELSKIKEPRVIFYPSEKQEDVSVSTPTVSIL
jgi:hypothetical protein